MWFGLAVLAGTCLFLLKARWNYVALPEIEDAASDAGVTVVVPARDEARGIARCVASFDVPVIVVNDASTDGTADAARAAGARVIEAPPLPPGAMGKPNACAAGARAAAGEWLLFVDADTWFNSGIAKAMVAAAERSSVHLLSVFLKQERVTWAERIVLPYAFALYFCGVSAASVNSDAGVALANGQCLLVKRDAYVKIGGHDAVRSSVIEDVALADLARRAGLRVRVGRAERLGSVRMYESFRAVWRGFEKNSFRFLRANPWTGGQVIAASVLLTSWLPAVVLSPWPLALAVAIAPVVLLRPWYGRWLDAAAAPLAIYLFQCIALAAMVKSLTGGKSVWKGRRV